MAVLRDATHRDKVVGDLGLDHLRRHTLRHTGLMWMADAGVPGHVHRTIRRTRITHNHASGTCSRTTARHRRRQARR